MYYSQVVCNQKGGKLPIFLTVAYFYEGLNFGIEELGIRMGVR
jgi:hypothetical protein